MARQPACVGSCYNKVPFGSFCWYNGKSLIHCRWRYLTVTAAGHSFSEDFVQLLDPLLVRRVRFAPRPQRQLNASYHPQQLISTACSLQSVGFLLFAANFQYTPLFCGMACVRRIYPYRNHIHNGKQPFFLFRNSKLFDFLSKSWIVLPLKKPID